MVVKIRKEESRVVIGLEGKITYENVNDLEKFVEENFYQFDGKEVILDFNRVEFIDSRGLDFVINFFRKVKDHGMNFKVINVSPSIYELFTIVRFDQLFEIKVK